jgi:hypothetical protein
MAARIVGRDSKVLELDAARIRRRGETGIDASR